MTPARTPKSGAARAFVLVAGLVFFSVQIADRASTGRASDQTLVYASLAVIALGLGAGIDWFRGGRP